MVRTPGKLGDAISTVDAKIGDGLERAVRHHHGRRLRRHGWHDIFTDPPAWWSDRVPVHQDNAITVLIDGHETMPAIAAAVAGARHSVHIAGWHTSPDFLMRPEGEDPAHDELKEILGEAAKRVPVRLLMWGGPPVPAFQPTRRTAKQVRDDFMDGTDIEVVLDTRERTLHCHHEKLVIIDGRLAFVGGIDMTALAGNRLDGGDHPAEKDLGWHDVGTLIEGPAVRQVAEHFLARWNEVAGQSVPFEEGADEQAVVRAREEAIAAASRTPSRGSDNPVLNSSEGGAPAPERFAGVDLQVLRTVPDRTYGFLPDGEYTILEAYLRALRKAERFVYLENQFLWSPEIVEVLVDKLQHPPTDDFRVLLVLPSKPNNGKDTTRGQLSVLMEADVEDDQQRLLATTLVGSTADSPGVYVHAKVGIIDDRWVTIGSANLNEHSLFNDTEMNVLTCDPRVARSTRLRLWAEHTRMPLSRLDIPVHEAIDTIWRPMAKEQSRISAEGGDAKHNVRLLDGVSRRTDRLQGPIRGLLVDG